MGVKIEKSLQKLKIELLNYPSVPVLIIYSKRKKSIQRNMYIVMFIVRLFTVVKTEILHKCLTIDE